MIEFQETHLDPKMRLWILVYGGLEGTGHRYYAYMWGWLQPEPQPEDLEREELLDFLSNSYSWFVEKTIGYTKELAKENIKRHINGRTLVEMGTDLLRPTVYAFTTNPFWR